MAPGEPEGGPKTPDLDSTTALQRRRAEREGEKAPKKPAVKTAPDTPPSTDRGDGRNADGQFVKKGGTDPEPAETARGNMSALEARKAAKSKAPDAPPDARTPEQVAAEAAEALQRLPKSEPKPGAEGEIPDITVEDIVRDPAKFAQQHKSLRGIHRSLEAQTRKATTLATGWETAYNRDIGRMKTYIQQLRSGQSQTPPSPAPASAAASGQPNAPGSPAPTSDQVAKKFSESVDWKQFHQLLNSQEFGATGAQIFLSQQLDGYVDTLKDSLKKEILESFGKEIEPLRKTHEMIDKRMMGREALQRARDTWNHISNSVDPQTGDPYFPELAADPKLVDEVLPIWLRFHPEFAMTDDGVWSAYLQWRDSRSRRSSAAEGAGATAASLVAALQSGGNSAARAVVTGGVQNGSGIPTPTPRTGEMTRQDRETAIKAGIRGAKTEHVTSSGISLGRTNR